MLRLAWSTAGRRQIAQCHGSTDEESFTTPDERVDLPGIQADVVDMADATITRSTFNTGMHCPQISIEGKPICMAHHTGYALTGGLHVQMQDGSTLDIAPNDVFDIPPGHDGSSVGPEPFLAIYWAGARTWMAERAGERVLMTLLFTDVVDSTIVLLSLATRLGASCSPSTIACVAQCPRPIPRPGDQDCRRRLHRGLRRRRPRDRGGGSHSRSLAHRRRIDPRRRRIRARWSSFGDDIAGVTVHEAARVASAAGRDEILDLGGDADAAPEPVSSSSRHVAPSRLKGLPGERALYAVTAKSEQND